MESDVLSGLLIVSLRTCERTQAPTGESRLQLEHSQAMVSRALRLANEHVYTYVRAKGERCEKRSVTSDVVEGEMEMMRLRCAGGGMCQEIDETR